MYVHKQLAVQNGLLQWQCTKGLLLIKHAVLSILSDASVQLVSTASTDILAPSYILTSKNVEV
jgi:hypothetical protein